MISLQVNSCCETSKTRQGHFILNEVNFNLNESIAEKSSFSEQENMNSEEWAFYDQQQLLLFSLSKIHLNDSLSSFEIEMMELNKLRLASERLSDSFTV